MRGCKHQSGQKPHVRVRCGTSHPTTPLSITSLQGNGWNGQIFNIYIPAGWRTVQRAKGQAPSITWPSHALRDPLLSNLKFGYQKSTGSAQTTPQNLPSNNCHHLHALSSPPLHHTERALAESSTTVTTVVHLCIADTQLSTSDPIVLGTHCSQTRPIGPAN